MPDRRILHLSSHQIACFLWQGGMVHADGSFENTAEGIAGFSRYVAEHENSVFTLVINLAEEGFLQETIPFLQKRDREAVIARKLSQLFYATTYSTAVSLGFEKTQRKDERLLFAALTASTTIDPWVAALGDARVPIAGILSLPFLGENLLKKLKVEDERCILLTAQDQSIRETYFERGRLHFSRLSPLANTSIGGMAQGFATEAVKLQQYLLSQRLISRNQVLRAIVVAHPQALPTIEASCISTESLAFQIVNSEECSRLCGLKNAPINSHIDALMAHLAVSTTSKAQFAKETLRHDYRVWQLRNGLIGVAAAMAVACTLFASKELYSAYRLNSEAEAVMQQASEARIRYEDIRRTFPPIPTTNETLRQVIDRYVELERDGGASPEGFYHDLGAALNQSPRIDVESITWKSGTAASADRTLQAASPSPNSQSAQISGTVNVGRRATPRQALTVFDQFVAALRANQSLEVKIIQRPFDIDSSKALKGAGETTVDSGKRPFALEITRRTQR